MKKYDCEAYAYFIVMCVMTTAKPQILCHFHVNS
jgi:hypothetical protein